MVEIGLTGMLRVVVEYKGDCYRLTARVVW